MLPSLDETMGVMGRCNPSRPFHSNERINNVDELIIKDLGKATAISLSQPFIRFYRENGSVYFVFNKTPLANRILGHIQQGLLTVNLKGFLRQQRLLKMIIHSGKASDTYKIKYEIEAKTMPLDQEIIGEENK